VANLYEYPKNNSQRFDVVILHSGMADILAVLDLDYN
jgi:hypothetical protein